MRKLSITLAQKKLKDMQLSYHGLPPEKKSWETNKLLRELKRLKPLKQNLCF
jgi:hypothetical protein